MAETDLIWMSVLVFLPTAFAAALLFLPKGWEEAMRWTALLGTVATLGVSIGVFILFKEHTLDRQGVLTNPDNRGKASLQYRASKLEFAPAVEAPDVDPIVKSAKADDWLGRVPWIKQFNINYYVGIDGISMALILLTTVIFFLSMIASWKIDKFVRGYCILFLVLETGVLGTFVALDFFLFYIFWEVMLLPMYFLIGIWGGPERAYAAIKFFLYTLFGSVLILIALLAFYFTNVRDFVSPHEVEHQARQIAERKFGTQNPTEEQIAQVHDDVVINTFDLVVLHRIGNAALQHFHDKPLTGVPAVEAARQAGGEEAAKEAEARVKAWFNNQGNWFGQQWFQYTMFWLLFIGFAIKMPIFPFHTWLPNAHVEAPTPISMILAGILLKLGGYGILRIAYPICPFAAEQLAWWLGLLGVINIVYGALAAMAQDDFKKLVAYSSISHMGYVLLGIAVWPVAQETYQYWAWGINGAMFQMIAHGISSAGMFFLVGVIYDRAHHRRLDNFKGLCEPMPLYAGLSAVIFFAAMGLPGMCGFVGEFMVILSTWNYSKLFAILAALTVVVTAAYILWTIQRVFFGVNDAYKNYSDIDPRELTAIVPLAILCVLLGVLPALLLSWMEPSITGLIDSFAAHVR